MDLLKDLKMLLLNFSFVIIYIFHKMILLLKNYLHYLKDNILSIIELYFIEKVNFFIIYNDEKLKA